MRDFIIHALPVFSSFEMPYVVWQSSVQLVRNGAIKC